MIGVFDPDSRLPFASQAADLELETLPETPDELLRRERQDDYTPANDQ